MQVAVGGVSLFSPEGKQACGMDAYGILRRHRGRGRTSKDRMSAYFFMVMDSITG